MGSSASGSAGGGSKAEDRTERELARAKTGLQKQPTEGSAIKKATDTFLIDIGIKPATTEYYANLPDRQAASSMMSSDKDDSPSTQSQAGTQAATQTASQPTTVGTESPGEARLGIRKDTSGQVIGRSMQPGQDKSATQQFVSETAPSWFRSDIYDATVGALEAGKPLENYRIEGRGTQGTLKIVFDDGTEIPTGFRDSKDVRAHAAEIVNIAKQYQSAGIGQQAKPEPTPVETAQTELEQRVEDLVRDPGDRAAEERARGTPEMDLGTAAGAQAERAAVIAETQAEQEAADALLKGRRSTILTTPGGLLAPEEGETTEARSLLGGRRKKAA